MYVSGRAGAFAPAAAARATAAPTDCHPRPAGQIITLDIGSTLVITTHAVVATFVNIPVAAANGIVTGAAGEPVLVVAFRVPVPACRCFLLVVANIHHQGAAVRYFDIHLHCLDAACLYGQGLAFWTDRFGLRPVVRVSDRQNWVSRPCRWLADIEVLPRVDPMAPVKAIMSERFVVSSCNIYIYIYSSTILI